MDVNEGLKESGRAGPWANGASVITFPIARRVRRSGVIAPATPRPAVDLDVQADRVPCVGDVVRFGSGHRMRRGTLVFVAGWRVDCGLVDFRVNQLSPLTTSQEWHAEIDLP